MLSGLFGVGGGFVIVPALVLFTGMGIHRAVATSLLVIALVERLGRGLVPRRRPRRCPWALTGLFVVGGVAGHGVGHARWAVASAAPACRSSSPASIVAVAAFIVLKSLAEARSSPCSSTSVSSPAWRSTAIWSATRRPSRCAVIDPTRDVDEYLDIAKREGLRITHVLETHVHADFVSGSAELKARLGGEAQVIVSGLGGKEWTPPYADHVVEDGDEVELGGVRLKAMHTPGHTPSMSPGRCSTTPAARTRRG